jgi:hypothetical protein
MKCEFKSQQEDSDIPDCICSAYFTVGILHMITAYQNAIYYILDYENDMDHDQVP